MVYKQKIDIQQDRQYRNDSYFNRFKFIIFTDIDRIFRSVTIQLPNRVVMFPNETTCNERIIFIR